MNQLNWCHLAQLRLGVAEHLAHGRVRLDDAAVVPRVDAGHQDTDRGVLERRAELLLAVPQGGGDPRPFQRAGHPVGQVVQQREIRIGEGIGSGRKPGEGDDAGEACADLQRDVGQAAAAVAVHVVGELRRHDLGELAGVDAGQQDRFPSGEHLHEWPGVVRAARPPLEQRPVPGFCVRLSAAHRGQLQFRRPA